MRIALFRLPSGTELVGDEVFAKYSGNGVQLSEFIDVEFPMLDSGSVTEALEAQRQAAITFHRQELARLVGSPESPVSLAKRQPE